MKAAHETGTVVSYDLNYRSKLWSADKSIEITKNLIPYIDVIIGNEEDFQKSFGCSIKGIDANLQTLPVEVYKEMVKLSVQLCVK